jgi:hypothetical protein
LLIHPHPDILNQYDVQDSTLHDIVNKIIKNVKDDKFRYFLIACEHPASNDPEKYEFDVDAEMQWIRKMKRNYRHECCEFTWKMLEKSMDSSMYLSFYFATLPFDFSKKLDYMQCDQLLRILNSLPIGDIFETDYTEERFGNLIKTREGTHFRTIEMYLSLMQLWYKVSALSTLSFDNSEVYQTLQAKVQSNELESELKRAFDLIILPHNDVPTNFITKTVEATRTPEFYDSAVYILWMSVLGGNETLLTVLLSESYSTESIIFAFTKKLVTRILRWICHGGIRPLNSEDGRVFSSMLLNAVTSVSFRTFIMLINPTPDVLIEYNVQNIDKLINDSNEGKDFYPFLIAIDNPASSAVDFEREYQWYLKYNENPVENFMCKLTSSIVDLPIKFLNLVNLHLCRSILSGNIQLYNFILNFEITLEALDFMKS